MKILELTMLTNNLSETKIFYSQTIGFEIFDEKENSVSFSVGNSKLIFESIENEQNPKYHFAFNIPLNKINKLQNG